MEENKQTLYNDELLDILPDGVIIFNFLVCVLLRDNIV